jgi:hypothetical protein
MNRMSKRSRAILKAIAGGDSFEQILIENSTVNYHDIFRAAAESSVLQDDRPRVRDNTKGLPRCVGPLLEATQSPHAVRRTWCD